MGVDLPELHFEKQNEEAGNLLILILRKPHYSYASPKLQPIATNSSKEDVILYGYVGN